MSQANSPIKVLRAALKRVEKRWGKGKWSEKHGDGQYHVCLEGAITGGCQMPNTEAQRKAIEICRQIIEERYGIKRIPEWNDLDNTTQEEVLEVIKLGIIRLETGFAEDDYIDPDEVDELIQQVD